MLAADAVSRRPGREGSAQVTDKDALRLREVGLGDAAYVEVVNVVAIQSSIERGANCLGVVPDGQPPLPSAP